MNDKHRQQIKEEVLEGVPLSVAGIGNTIVNLDKMVDLAISKTAKAIFKEMDMLTGKDGYIYTTDDDYEELKKKWCDGSKG